MYTKRIRSVSEDAFFAALESVLQRQSRVIEAYTTFFCHVSFFIHSIISQGLRVRTATWRRISISGRSGAQSYRLTSCPSGSARPSRERSHHSLHADDDRQRVATRRRDIQPHCVMSLVRPRWIIRSCAIARPRGRTGDQPGAQEVVRGCVRAFATNGTIRFRARQHMGKVALAAPALVEPPWPMLYGAR